jgi:hypothetical protein
MPANFLLFVVRCPITFFASDVRGAASIRLFFRERRCCDCLLATANAALGVSTSFLCVMCPLGAEPTEPLVLCEIVPSSEGLQRDRTQPNPTLSIRSTCNSECEGEGEGLTASAAWPTVLAHYATMALKLAPALEPRV